MCDDAERMVAFVRGIEERCATRTELTSVGPAFFRDDLPRLYDMNFLRIETGASPDEIVTEVERVQQGLRHRKLSVDDERRGAELEPELRSRGWIVEHHLYMPLRESPEPGDRPAHVTEVPAERLRPAWVQGSLAVGRDPEVAEQSANVREVIAGAVPTRFYAVLVDGEPASWCELYEQEGVAQIEGVMTAEAQRNRGHARAVISAAIEAARSRGAELVFLIADAGDWPKELYHRLGFVDGPILHRFRREV